MTKAPKRPRDVNQLAKLIADIATGEATEPVANETNRQRASAAAGSARAKKLSPERRTEIAKAAADKRWKKPQA